MGMRACSFCGKAVPERLTQCPYCREAIPEIRLSKRDNPQARKKIREGLLIMLMAAALYYFSAGYGAWQLPSAIQPLAATYASPFLLFLGVAYVLYGLYRTLKS
jgi:hypothetical protein